ncbi:pyridoxal-phosphate dependent enzyme [Hirschia litorea]|uniref:Pyridoxal-phosphate dependent enzyme n=1 Tax=Hirschia litorea TaxID=1199156 RepID=A0ABW2IID6_9PROT
MSAENSKVGLPISPDDIYKAAKRIGPYVHRTPVLTSARLNEIFGAELFFKCENFQHIGAFKARGAHNAVFALNDADASKGVVAHSSGNHAAALCLAAVNRGISAKIVMPHNSARVKIDAVKRLGGEINFCEPSISAREAGVEDIMARTGAALVHPYNDAHVIAGQGTTALEFLEECPDLDALLAPIGGGGLLSGCAIIAKALKENIFVCGVEPLHANDAFRSWKSGTMQTNTNAETIADGLRGQLGDMALDIFLEKIDHVIEVSEEDIVQAMRLVWSELKIVIEPSSAVPVASLLKQRACISGDKIGIVVSGGNVDLDALPW